MCGEHSYQHYLRIKYDAAIVAIKVKESTFIPVQISYLLNSIYS